MPKQAPAAAGNRILERLSAGDRALLQPHLTRVKLPLRKRLEEPHTPVEHIYFIETGFASVVAGGAGQNIEVGLIGREGMTGLSVIMGAKRSPNATFMQSAGEGLRVRAAKIVAAMERSTTLRRVLLKYAHAYLVQTAQTAAANGHGKVEERLARWLLMSHDRVGGTQMVLTHEFLSVMLGVRRASVSVALGVLEQKKLIRARRGIISVLNRKGLHKLARGSYGVAEAEFQRLFG
jgi:CRP-like cAMP-binding protein